MHYLVTGAQGFLGKLVVKKLRAAGIVVSASGRRPDKDLVCCDLAAASDFARMIEQIAPDRILHCAAHVPFTPAEYQDGESAQGNLKMIDTVISASLCPVVFISSMTVYGVGHDRPVAEKDAGHPTSAYGISKLQGEQRLIADGRPSLAIRIPGLFGPSRQAGLVYNILHALKMGKHPQLPRQSFLWAAMHVDDAADSIVKLAVSPINKFEAINVGYRGKSSIETLVNLSCKIFGQQVAYDIKQPYFEFDLALAEIYDVVPKSNFEEALIKFSTQI